MTSPRESKSDSVADLESASIQDELQIAGLEPGLTAAEHQPIPKKEQQEPEPQTESAIHEDSQDHVTIKPESVEEQLPEGPGALGDAIIPDGAGLNLDEQYLQAQYNANIMAGMADFGLDQGLLAATMAANTAFNDPFTMNGLPFSAADMNAALNSNIPFLEPSPNIYGAYEPPEPQETRIQAYAKLEFADGMFYMNTYSLILGRDLAAHRAAIRREEMKRELAEANLQTPNQERNRVPKSVVSESGGFLGEEHDFAAERELRRQQSRGRASKASKASKKSKSSSSSSHHHSRRNSEGQPANGLIEYQPQTQVKRSGLNTAGAVPVDPDTLRPSPYDCPIIGIHPPADADLASYKNISRKHMKIKFNQKKHHWEAIFMGRNGGFINDEFHPCGAVIALTSGAILQAGGVSVRFVLPDVAIGETGAEEESELGDNGAERYMEGGKEMSYEFEAAHGELLEDTSEEESENGGEHEGDEEEEEEEEDDEQDEIDDRSDVQESIEGDGLGEDGREDEKEQDGQNDQSPQADERDEEASDTLQQPQPSLPSTKKRGPGRPPKNGIMSKRELREQKLAQKAEEKKAKSQPQSQDKASKKDAPPEPGKSEKTKNPVGRPRIHPRPDEPEAPREKRKYTKRKPKEPKDGEVKPEGSGEDVVKEKKDKKPPKPPRSPSPTFNEEDLTPEQLAKPSANYVTLIHEALLESATGQMSLPQIYRAIMRKYPYFVLKVTTNGWQSSVRHNLSQHMAFEKKERDGKGWMWAIVEGSSIEKEKKRRTPPPQPLPPGHMQPIYPGGPYMMHPNGQGMMGPPPGYYQIPPHFQPGQPPPYMGQPYGHIPGPYPPLTGPPPGFPVAMPPQLAAPNNQQSYSSPYAPKPPPQSGSPPNGSQPNEQRPPIEEKPGSPSQASAVAAIVQQPMPTSQSQQTQPIQPIQQQQQPQSHSQVPQATQPPGPPQLVYSSQAQVPQAEALQPQKPPQAHRVHTPQQSAAVSQPEPPVFNDVVMRAVHTFKATMLAQMEGTSDASDAEGIVNAAVNRVLKKPFQTTGTDKENVLVKTLSNILSQIAGSNYPGPTEQQNGISPPSAQPEAHTQVGASQPPAKSASERVSIARPSFMGVGQNRPNGASVPRPPMGTPGMQRTNSSNQSRPAAASDSPAPAPATSQGSPNGASTPQMAPLQSPKEPVQLAGQKRPLEDDADDMREFKKLTTSGPPQLKT